jgi:hypothetical protein
VFFWFILSFRYLVQRFIENIFLYLNIIRFYFYLHLYCNYEINNTQDLFDFSVVHIYFEELYNIFITEQFRLWHCA